MRTYTSMAYMHYRHGPRSHHLDMALQDVVGSEGPILVHSFRGRSFKVRLGIHVAEKGPTLLELVIRMLYERSGLPADHPVMSSALSINGGWTLFLE
jgi:hypothetical protein